MRCALAARWRTTDALAGLLSSVSTASSDADHSDHRRRPNSLGRRKWPPESLCLLAPIADRVSEAICFSLLQLEAEASIETLMAVLEAETGVPAAQQVLIHNGRQLPGGWVPAPRRQLPWFVQGGWRRVAARRLEWQ